ncbi:MAG: hypothetical protein IKT29_06955 [Flavobacteriales bacterium]|nr:hypothetical protein [Flavobacteriales bacterium]
MQGGGDEEREMMTEGLKDERVMQGEDKGKEMMIEDLKDERVMQGEEIKKGRR